MNKAQQSLVVWWKSQTNRCIYRRYIGGILPLAREPIVLNYLMTEVEGVSVDTIIKEDLEHIKQGHVIEAFQQRFPSG